MRNWQVVRLGDICDKITDGTHHSPANHAEGDFKYITAKNIKPWGLDLSDVTYIDADTHREIYSRCDVKKGDLLYVKDGVNTGRVAINPLDEEFSLLSSVAVLRPGPAVSGKYLAYALQESQTLERMLDDMAGVAITRLTLRKLNDAEIPLAPLNCQTRIVEKLEELLSDLDAGVAELKVAQRKLAQYRQSLLKAAVEGALTADWRAARAKTGKSQETGAQLLQRILTERRAHWEAKQFAKFAEQGKAPPTGWKGKYKEPVAPDVANLPALPVGWAWACAEQLCDFITKGTTPPTRSADGINMTIPFLRVTNLTNDGSLDLSDRVFVSPETHLGFLARSIAYPGDVLMNIVGPPLGQVSVVPTDFTQWNINQAIAIFRAVEGVSPNFICTMLLSAVSQRWLKARAKTTAGQTNLTLELCRNLPVPLPPMAEQLAITELIHSALDSEKEQVIAINHGLKQSAAQRKNILKAAFAGQLVPQDPNDEPASALLGRIRAERGYGGDKRARKHKESA